MLIDALKEEHWGYFRPGYYPIEKGNVVPAMVCLSEALTGEPNIQFVLVKTDCYLKAWEDALFVSEKDYAHITGDQTQPPEDANEKIKLLTDQFIAKGYLPLTQIKTEVRFNALH
jgi:hypothetical protein